MKVFLIAFPINNKELCLFTRKIMAFASKLIFTFILKILDEKFMNGGFEKIHIPIISPFSSNFRMKKYIIV